MSTDKIYLKLSGKLEGGVFMSNVCYDDFICEFLFCGCPFYRRCLKCFLFGNCSSCCSSGFCDYKKILSFDFEFLSYDE